MALSCVHHSGARLGTIYAIEGSSGALASDDVSHLPQTSNHLAARRPQFTDVNAIPEAVVTKSERFKWPVL